MLLAVSVMAVRACLDRAYGCRAVLLRLDGRGLGLQSRELVLLAADAVALLQK